MIELPRARLEAELAELRMDLEAFRSAKEVVERRCFEAQERRYHPILQWQGADASLFVLGACIGKIEGVIGEYMDILERMNDGEIRNTGEPVLRLVEPE